MHKAMLTAALLVACAGQAGVVAAQESSAPNTPLLQAEQRSLGEFVKTKAPKTFEFALTDLGAATVSAVHGTERDRLTDAWFALFHALDSVKDPAFDPSDLPQLNLVPPPDHGMTYFAGVDPSALSDPVARAKYEKALSANHAKAVRFAAAYPLVDLDTRARAAFRLYRTSAYPSTPADASDFRRLLAKSGLTAARKKSIAS